jgi:hypothetical protein
MCTAGGEWVRGKGDLIFARSASWQRSVMAEFQVCCSQCMSMHVSFLLSGILWSPCLSLAQGLVEYRMLLMMIQ